MLRLQAVPRRHLHLECLHVLFGPCGLQQGMTACCHHVAVIIVAAHNGWCVICGFELGWRQAWFDFIVMELFKLVVEVLFEGGLRVRHVLNTLQ